MRTILILLLLTLLVINSVDIGSEASKLRNKKNSVSDKERRKFIPTQECQVIGDGQVMPAGLHYRTNLQTGLREAKLLDENNKESNPKTAVTLVSHMAEDNCDELKEEIKHPNGFDFAPGKDAGEYSIKKATQDFNQQIKTDQELLGDLLTRFASRNINKYIDEEIITMLSDLEYLVHNYDNALKFARMGGLTQVIYPCLNASSVGIQSQAIILLGSAVQNNPQLQIMALDTGIISSLMHLLMPDNSPIVHTRAVYALSCLIRRFPMAQLIMINGGGLAILGTFFQNVGQDGLKLQIKIITLLCDLVMEYKEANEALNVPDIGANLEELIEKQTQYNMVNLPERLAEEGWCKRLLRLLKVSAINTDLTGDFSLVVAEDLPSKPELDMMEKVIEAMLCLVDYCINDFKSEPDVPGIVASLEQWYNELSVREQPGKTFSNSREFNDCCLYYTSVAKQTRKLSEKLK